MKKIITARGHIKVLDEKSAALSVAKFGARYYEAEIPMPQELIEQPIRLVEEPKCCGSCNYEQMTVVELREEAKQRGLSGYGNKSKTNLIELLSCGS
jgi:hypothetical protein